MSTENDRIAQLRRRKVRPSTPGDLLADLMERNGLTQSEVARRLNVSRHLVHEVVNDKRALSADLALRLGVLFRSGPGLWLQMQANVQLWDALHASPAPYAAIEPLPLAA